LSPIVVVGTELKNGRTIVARRRLRRAAEVKNVRAFALPLRRKLQSIAFGFCVVGIEQRWRDPSRWPSSCCERGSAGIDKMHISTNGSKPEKSAAYEAHLQSAKVLSQHV
jgi:hypothetical protein